MGYDLRRFTNVVVNELLCSLCHLVINNGVESINCQHLYCDQCLKSWLELNSFCPIDRQPLIYRQTRPVTLALRNLLLSLEISCDFEAEGCQEIVTLKYLEDHVKQCAHNPSLKFKCTLGCGLEITQTEYNSHNCMEKLANLVIDQQKRIRFLEHSVSETKEKNDWRITNGLVFSGNDTIECQSYRSQLAQHHNPLDFCSYFMVKILSLGDERDYIRIGLFNRYFLGENCVPSEENSVINFRSNGTIHAKHDMSTAHVSDDWRDGDTIICGIKFTKSNANENKIAVYFNHNSRLVAEKSIKYSEEQLYPTVYVWSNGTTFMSKLFVGTRDFAI